MKNKFIRNLVLCLTLIMVTVSFSGCSSSTNPTSSGADTVAKIGDADKKAILVVSFGTSYNETRAKTIDAIEEKVKNTYSDDYDVRRAFTSQIIIDKLKSRDGLEINNVDQAMQSFVNEGFGTLYIQPTHVMNGEEYDELCAAVEPYIQNFETIRIGKPLLTSTEDYEELVNIIKEETKELNEEGTAVVFMGHGTSHFANATYACLDYHMKHEISENYFVGTVEGYPTITEVIGDVEKQGATKVTLLPFMIVSGDHANNDMAGDEEDSWKTQFKQAGYEVDAVLKGLGEYEGVQNMVVEHLQAAIDGPVE
ncbi:MAG: sirohydrochlorin cobaltochelatase [Sedimentibacter sp.]